MLFRSPFLPNMLDGLTTTFFWSGTCNGIDFFFFLYKGWGRKTPVLQFHISTWQVQPTEKPFTILALKDLKFEERAFDFTKSTLEQEIETQSGPWAPLPPLASDLQATPRSSELRCSGSPFRRATTSASKREAAGDEPLGSFTSPSTDA